MTFEHLFVYVCEVTDVNFAGLLGQLGPRPRESWIYNFNATAIIFFCEFLHSGRVRTQTRRQAVFYFSRLYTGIVYALYNNNNTFATCI